MRWRLLAAFAVGLLVGTASMAPVAGRSVERLRLERDALINRVTSLEKQIAALQQTVSRQQNRSVPVGAVQVRVNHDDTRVAIEVERVLQRDLTRYVGRPVREVEPADLWRRFHGRLIKVDDTRYITRIAHVVIAEQFELAVDLEEIPAEQ